MGWLRDSFFEVAAAGVRVTTGYEVSGQQLNGVAQATQTVATVVVKSEIAEAKQEIQQGVEAVKMTATAAKIVAQSEINEAAQEVKNTANAALFVAKAEVAQYADITKNSDVKNVGDDLQQALKEASPRSTITAKQVSGVAQLCEKIYDMEFDRTTGALKQNAMMDRLRSEGYEVTAIPSKEDPEMVGAIVAVDKDKNTTVAFRGTASISDVLTDVKGLPTELPGSKNGATVHQGVKEGLLESGMWQEVRKNIPSDAANVTFSGHSLGGAYASLASVVYAQESGARKSEVITFGAPRVGDDNFALDAVKATNGNIARFVAANDPVSSTGLGVHAGRPIYFDDKKGYSVGLSADSGTNQQALAAGVLIALNGGVDQSHGSSNYVRNLSIAEPIPTASVEISAIADAATIGVMKNADPKSFAEAVKFDTDKSLNAPAMTDHFSAVKGELYNPVVPGLEVAADMGMSSKASVGMKLG